MRNQIAPAFSTRDLFSDGPLSLVNCPIPRALRQPRTAARDDNCEQGENCAKHAAVDQSATSNIFHDLSPPLTSSQASEAEDWLDYGGNKA
jgi:hypothetical protein